MQFVVVGALVSILIEFIVHMTGATKTGAKVITLVVSIALSALLWYIWKSPYGETFVNILGGATVFYGFVLKGPSDKLQAQGDRLSTLTQGD
jgi:hypothetical protein